MKDSMQNSHKRLMFNLCLVICTIYILRAFVPGLIWGGILALSLWSTANKLSKIASPSAVPLGLTVGLGVSFIAPLLYVGSEIYAAWLAVDAQIKLLTINNFKPPVFLNKLPYSEYILELWKNHIQNADKLKELKDWVLTSSTLEKLTEVGSQASDLLMVMLIALVCFYFLIKNKDNFEPKAKFFLDNTLGPDIANSVVASLSFVKGTINGVVLIGLLEGFVLSIPLVSGGMPAGILIGFAAGILGVIPLVLPVMILPCVGYFYLNGQILFAILTTISLMLVWFLFENIYKPKLISDAVKIHPLVVLMSLIGGLQTLGALGLLIGPAVVASTLGVLNTLREKQS